MGQRVQFHLERWREDRQDGREEEGRKEKAGGKVPIQPWSLADQRASPVRNN